MVSQAGKVVLSVEKEIEVGGEGKKVSYEFSMPLGSPYGQAYDSAHSILQEILVMADTAAKQAERNQEEPAVEEVS